MHMYTGVHNGLMMDIDNGTVAIAGIFASITLVVSCVFLRWTFHQTIKNEKNSYHFMIENHCMNYLVTSR